MKTVGRMVVIMGIFAVVGITFYWPVIRMELAGSAEYREQDTLAYRHFTPALLKAVPRLSQNYIFDYTRIDGPGSVIYTLTFSNAPDVQKLRDYLTTMGYSRQTGCAIGEECWKGNQADETVYLVNTPERHEVAVSVDYTPQTR